MSFQTRIEQHFENSIETLSAARQVLIDPIGLAAETLTATLLQGGKVLCCGNGRSGAIAQMFALMLIDRFQRERPGLPAIALNANAGYITGIADTQKYSQIYAQQIRTLAQTPDTLVLFSDGSNALNLRESIAAANDRSVTVILINSADSASLGDMLPSSAVEIRIPATSPHRSLELQLLVSHCICDLIDIQIFGEEL